MVSTPEQVKDHFLAALDRPTPEARANYLDAACGGDEAVRREVEVLLAAHDQPDSRLDGAAHLERPGLEATSFLDDSPGVGATIGPYKLHELIGEGGMGLVYLAEQQRPVRRLVALKIIKPGMDSRQVIARFEAERQALAMMDHPNIARILDAGTVGEGKDEGGRLKDEGQAPDSSFIPHPSSFAFSRPYFVMELVRGLPINEFCDQKRLTVRQRLELFIQVCQAVQHAHQKGIIHRDLKPTNVLVTMLDAIAVPKVIDFGIAKALSPLPLPLPLGEGRGEGFQLTDHTLVTGFAQMIGTPLYMSPEQADMNQLGVDTRSDVYSLGVILYELLTGTTPFDKATLTKAGLDEMRRIIREVEPETVSARLARTKSSRHAPRDVPNGLLSRSERATVSELDWIVMKALEKDRTCRYESASSFAADIERYLSGDLVHACPPSSIYRFQKFARKNKTALTTAALLAASLLLGITASTWQAIRATAAEAQAVANEAKAKEATTAEAAQRAQAEENLQVALEALDRMLLNVMAAELNEVPRVLPLRRQLLKDALAFFERISPPSTASPDARARAARTWSRIAHYARRLDEPEQILSLRNKAINILTQLVAEHPNERTYRSYLADEYNSLANDSKWNDPYAAEKADRRSCELYAELANEDPQTFAVGYAGALLHHSRELRTLGKDHEANGCVSRALDIAPADHRVHWEAMFAFAMFNIRNDTDRADEQFRRAIAGYRKTLEKLKDKKREPGIGPVNNEHTGFAGKLDIAAVAFETRHPDEAEALRDEAIAVMKAVVGPSPAHRGQHRWLIASLADQGRFLRRRAATQTNQDSYQIAQRLKKADDQFLEAISQERLSVSRFMHPNSRDNLVTLLQEEVQFLLEPLAEKDGANTDTAARKLKSDALLTEAVQLCRALAAEFPENDEYKKRLAELLKLQVLHFGPIASLKHDLDEAQELGKHEAAEALARQLLAAGEKALGKDHDGTLSAVEGIAWSLYRQGKFLDAEPYFRQWVEWTQKHSPNHWETFNRQSCLGEFMFRAAGELQPKDPAAAAEKLTQAERELLASYEGIKLRRETIPAESRKRVPEAAQRLVRFYTAQNKPDQAAKWQAELDALTEPENRQRSTTAPPPDP